MSDSKYLEAYLKFNEDGGESCWPSKLREIGVEKYDLMYVSIHLFDILFPEKTHNDFMNWRHHRKFNEWQDDIYWMSDTEFNYYWPLITSYIHQYNKEEDNSDD